MTKLKFTASLAAVLILAMIMTAAAMAAGGYVGWDGIFHVFGENPLVRIPGNPARKTAGTYDDILSQISRGEYWSITKDGAELASMHSEHRVHNEDDFHRLINGTVLPKPILPEGYEFFMASILTEPEEMPYEEITLDDGAVLSKYRTKEPTSGGITNYDYSFSRINGGNLHSINARTAEFHSWLVGEVPAAYIDGDEVVEVVEVEGFEHGLTVRSGSHSTQLHLLKMIEDDVLIVEITAFDDLPEEALLHLFGL